MLGNLHQHPQFLWYFEVNREGSVTCGPASGGHSAGYREGLHCQVHCEQSIVHSTTTVQCMSWSTNIYSFLSLEPALNCLQHHTNTCLASITNVTSSCRSLSCTCVCWKRMTTDGWPSPHGECLVSCCFWRLHLPPPPPAPPHAILTLAVPSTLWCVQTNTVNYCFFHSSSCLS